MKKILEQSCFKLFLLIVVLLVTARAAAGSTVVLPSDDDLIVGARAIVRGKVVSINCAADEADGRIFTYITLRVREVLRGEITSRRIIIKEPGGEVGDRGSTVFGVPKFKPGEEVLLYLDTWADGSLRVHQMLLGKFSVIRDSRTNKRLVVRDLSEATLVVQDGHTPAAADATTNRMELDAYRAMVRRRLAANLERAAEFEATHYGSIPLLARPPEYDRVAGGGLESHFVLFPSATPARWFEPDTNAPVVFLVNPAGAPNSAIMDDVTSAMNTWSTVAGCSLRVVNAGTIEQCTGINSPNTIVFNNCDGWFAPTPGCASILAICGMNWTTAERKEINGTTFNRIVQGHISFNPYASCNFNDHCKIQEIATHELGHTLGLGHSQFVEATMFGTAHFDGRCASLHQDDRDGILFIYPVQNTEGGPLAVTTDSLSPGRVGAQYLQVLAATGGALPYRWSLVPDTGRVPPGLTFNSNGIIAGLPLEAGTNEFIARVTDADGNAAQKAFSITITSASSPYDSEFISQAVPATLQAAQTFSVNLRWRNTGIEVWNGAAGFRLGSQNPANNNTWGGDRVLLSPQVVPPGQELDITFTAFAPRTAGTYNFQWQLFQDGPGFFGQASANVQVTVTDGNTLVITSPSAVEATRGVSFSHALTASGGVPPYGWEIVGGSLPAGLILNTASGVISGTPTLLGTSPLTVQVTDGSARTAQKAITISVNGPPLEITTSALPSVMRGTQYSHGLTAAGGTPAYVWSVATGNLPAGLALNSATGVISGVPLSDGTFDFTADVRDSENRSARKPLSITITPTPLSVEVASSVEALKGVAFAYLPTATGGRPPYNWSVTAGVLPPGLSLDAQTGAIAGVTTASGTFNLTLSVRDSGSDSVSRLLQIKVIDPETIPRVTRAKYKTGKRQLKVEGERFDPAAVLRLDGNPVAVRLKSGALVVKRLVLAAGQHEVRVINPGGTSSPPFVFFVD